MGTTVEFGAAERIPGIESCRIECYCPAVSRDGGAQLAFDMERKPKVRSKIGVRQAMRDCLGEVRGKPLTIRTGNSRAYLL
jgi:hypothetical protein